MFNPLNETIWSAHVAAAHPSAQGRMRPGLQVTHDIRMLGRLVRCTYEVVEVDGEQSVRLRLHPPFSFNVFYELDSAPAGTWVTLRAEGGTGALLMLTGPLLRAWVRYTMRRNLARLKRHLEHASWETP